MHAALGFNCGRKSGTERAGRPIRKGASRRGRLRGILYSAGVTEMTSPAESLTCGVLVSRSLGRKDDDLADVSSRGELSLGLRDLGQGEGAADLGPDISAASKLDKPAEMNPGVHGRADQLHIVEVEAT